MNLDVDVELDMRLAEATGRYRIADNVEVLAGARYTRMELDVDAALDRQGPRRSVARRGPSSADKDWDRSSGHGAERFGLDTCMTGPVVGLRFHF